MPKSPEIPPDLSKLPPPKPLDNFMFAANFQSMDDAPSAMSLTNAVLQNATRPTLEVIDELNCEQVLLGEGRKLRGCRLDLMIREREHRLNFEVQLTSLPHMADRMVFNMSRMLSLNTIPSTTYSDLPKITLIAIVNFPYRKSHSDFHQPFGLYYEKDPELVTNKFDYHLIDMTQFRKLKPDFTNSLHRWLFFLDEGYKDPNNPIVKEVLQMDQGLYQFAQKYQYNISDPIVLNAYYGYIMEGMDERDRIEGARMEGEAIGIAKGETHRNAEIARNALGMGISIENIMLLTGLSHAEIQALVNES